MDWTISHIPASNIVSIETTGTMTLQRMNELVEKALQAGARYHSRLFLVDHRKIELALTETELANRPTELNRLGFPKNSRVAHVYSDRDLEAVRLMEKAMLGGGYQMRIFADVPAAKEWLCGE